MSHEPYRYYVLDCLGELHNAELFEAKSDEEAIAKIAAEHPDAQCEIWQGRRLVASILPTRRRA